MNRSTRRHNRKARQRKLARQNRFLQFESLEQRQLLAADITGAVFNDVNGDGVRDQGEDGVANWTVFLDTNQDGVLDIGEPSDATDGDGKYEFLGVVADDYRVAQVLRTGWTATNPAAGFADVTAVDGENVSADFLVQGTSGTASITGNVWRDLNGNGIKEAGDTGVAGWTVFIDLDGDKVVDPEERWELTDGNGDYTFTGVLGGSPGDAIDYEVQQLLTPGWEPSEGSNENLTAKVIEGETTVLEDFFNKPIAISGIEGSVFSDINSNGLREASEAGLSGWTVYLDLNTSNTHDTGEPSAITNTAGNYSIAGIEPGAHRVAVVQQPNYQATRPAAGFQTVVAPNDGTADNVNFGQLLRTDAAIGGVIYADRDKDGVRDPGEEGLAGITVYIDDDDDGVLDPSERSVETSDDLFYTPDDDEAGSYRFESLPGGTYVVRHIVPDELSATPLTEREHTITLGPTEDRSDVDSADVYRPSEIHGTKFEDINGDGSHDSGEPGLEGVTIFVDLNRNNILDTGEPSTVTDAEGKYWFDGLEAGAYVVREIVPAGFVQTFPDTGGGDGILWPDGVSNPAVGNVSPLIIETYLAQGDLHTETVSLTLPTSGALTDMVDVFLLFDDTGSFRFNGPIVRAAFPNIIAELETRLPGLDLGFGVGRLEEYGNFGAEYSTGRPFVLNQPVIASSAAGYTDAEVLASIQAALDREAPGYGGDRPETVIEALFQMVTGAGFDGNNNGSLLDSGAAGLASTQVTPGNSGDVPPFASFTADPTNGVVPASGTIGGAGFRSGALPIIITATDTGFAYQPKGETNIVGIDGLTLPASSITHRGRGTTPFSSGAGIQETVTGLNALGALVIGLGVNDAATQDPRIGLEALANLTGAINRTTTSIDNGTPDPIDPGDPFYFKIVNDGTLGNIADGIVAAIDGAVTSVNVNVTLRASDPRVLIDFTPGVINGLGAGDTATFDVTFTGDGRPHRFDLQFVREGTDVVLGSIPVVLGTPIEGEGYEYEDCDDGVICVEANFGNQRTGSVTPNVAPSFTAGANQTVGEDSGLQTVAAWATNISPGPASESGQNVDFIVSNDNNALFAGQPVISPTGALSYTPADDAFGSAVVTVQLHDDGGTAGGGVDTSAPQLFTINVTAANDAPIVVNDSYSTNEDTALTIAADGVLANDSDIDSVSITAIEVTPPTSGSLTLNANGSFTYTPNADFDGLDSFAYKANDGALDSNVATVNITVNAVNDASIAANDSYTTDEDIALVIAAAGVLANDSDLDGDALTAVLATGPSNGAVTLNSDGSFSYASNANFNGTDSFTYTANDGALDSNVATVNITVNAVNDAPVAVNDSYSVNEDTSLTTLPDGVLDNDSDVDGDALTAILVAGPSNGTLRLNSTGWFTYVPNIGFNGSDSFTYTANDGAIDSNVATVNITVGAVNDAPVAVNDSFSTAEDTTLTIASAGVLGNDLDGDGDTLTAVQVTGPTNGGLTLHADGSFTYTPNANFNGSDSFTYKANDGALDSNVAIVNITIGAVNDAPVAVDDSYSTSEDTALTIAAAGVLGNDSDIDGDALTAIRVAGPANGSVTLNADGSFTYTPNADFNGSDSFTYKANDGALDSNVATVNITIGAVNDAPVAADDSYSTSEDTALTIAAAGVLGNDSDIDGDALTAIRVAGPANGSVTLNADGSFTYTPNADFNGSDSFTYKANDGTLDSNVAIVDITVGAVNDAPVAADDSYSTSEDTALTIAAAGVLANDRDIDGDPLTAVQVVGPTNGSVTLNADGSFTYAPNANFNGSDSFTYKANDGALDSNVAMVNITANPVNDAPVASDDSYITDQDTPLSIPPAGVLGNDSDVDGDSLTAAVVVGPANGSATLNANGALTYTPNAGFSGTDSFTYQASDGVLLSAEATVTIQVNAVPEPGGTKFFVVDQRRRSTFQYDADGNSLGDNRLNEEDEKPRGIAASPDGSTLWVVDKKGEVFVYDSDSQLLGSWEIEEVDKPEGITVHGDDLWIVDREEDRVYFFEGGALLRSGEAEPTSSFSLGRGNRNPMDLVTDGSHLWVVNNTRRTDKVFRYSIDGELEGSWQIDVGNTQPTGLTIDPHDVNHIWIVDSRSDRVYQYNEAAERTSGEQTASASFALDPANRNPQGIADPKASLAADSLDGGWESFDASAADSTLGWDNLTNPLDPNDDGEVSPLDVLLVINQLNQNGSADVASLDVDAPFVDVTADGVVSPLDALSVINFLNRPSIIPPVALIGEAVEQLAEGEPPLQLTQIADELAASDDNASRSQPTTEVASIEDERTDPNVEAAIIDLFGENADDALRVI